jgi:hypothetical protein
VWAGSDAAPELGLDQVFVRPRQGMCGSDLLTVTPAA